jgi:hypothetical protein
MFWLCETFPSSVRYAMIRDVAYIANFGSQNQLSLIPQLLAVWSEPKAPPPHKCKCTRNTTGAGGTLHVNQNHILVWKLTTTFTAPLGFWYQIISSKKQNTPWRLVRKRAILTGDRHLSAKLMPTFRREVSRCQRNGSPRPVIPPF